MVNTAYFDNAATTFPKPEIVYDFMNSYYRTNGVNIGRGKYAMASGAKGIVDETRLLLLKLFHCENKKVVFTPSATEALNIIIQGLSIPKGSNVYVTPFEHNAVTRVLNYLVKKSNVNIHELIVDSSSYAYDIQKIKEQFIHTKPDAVIMTHASNVCGIVSPVVELCGLAKLHGAYTVVDMSQTAGLVDMNLSNENVDFAVFAGHKTLYGPFGIAGFITSGQITLEPLLYGGTGSDSGNPEVPKDLPQRYEVGSQNILAIAGLNAALNWIESIGIEKIYQVEQINHHKLISMLKSYDNIKIVGYNEQINSIGVVSCVFKGYSADSIGQVLSEHNIAVRTGLHCAPIAHKFLHTYPAGTVRFSVGYFNSDDDFERLKMALNYIEDNS